MQKNKYELLTNEIINNKNKILRRTLINMLALFCSAFALGAGYALQNWTLVVLSFIVFSILVYLTLNELRLFYNKQLIILETEFETKINELTTAYQFLLNFLHKKDLWPEVLKELNSIEKRDKNNA